MPAILTICMHNFTAPNEKWLHFVMELDGTLGKKLPTNLKRKYACYNS
jgi:hypothetical protein